MSAWHPYTDSLFAPSGISIPAEFESEPAPFDPKAIRPSILALDDDPFMLELQSRMLRSMGYDRVRTASSAKVALLMLQADPESANVIVCDLNMPGMDGIEFLQKVNAGPFRGNVILLSGEGARIMHTVQRLLGGGRLVILGALEKPASRQALRALLDCWKPISTATPVEADLTFSCAEVDEAQRRQQWVLHYQPKVDLRTGALAGVEALVRWDHPQRGIIYPDRFISIAEECDAIDALTDWVLQEAVKALRTFHDQGLRTGMAVNVSMENLRAPDFAHRVSALVRRAGLSSTDLTLEITESRLMSPSPAPLESLVRLRLQRFGLAIDDFGTGHSSLAQLRDVPFTELKIDRGFVRGARANQIIRPMLDGSVGIAKKLGMRSVAEGVETEDDWHLLREIDCDFAQGYFIGRPMPGNELPGWLGSWQARRRALV
jgi:EAL domain-containing protein (putative c-di-GMP-specific phosphodiesterase class I)/ActR/RegA family two-component response regulator